jgi:hypothetical protein
MGERRGLRSAWRVEGPLQTSIQLCTTLTDGEIHNALRNKRNRKVYNSVKISRICCGREVNYTGLGIKINQESTGESYKPEKVE